MFDNFLLLNARDMLKYFYLSSLLFHRRMGESIINNFSSFHRNYTVEDVSIVDFFTFNGEPIAIHRLFYLKEFVSFF